MEESREALGELFGAAGALAATFLAIEVGGGTGGGAGGTLRFKTGLGTVIFSEGKEVYN